MALPGPWRKPGCAARRGAADSEMAVKSVRINETWYQMAGKPRSAAGTLRVRRRRLVGRVIR